MSDEKRVLRMTCPPCGEVFAADDEEALIAIAVEHARKLHDVDLLKEMSFDELRRIVRRGDLPGIAVTVIGQVEQDPLRGLVSEKAFEHAPLFRIGRAISTTLEII
jgi:predicted small metal-binding protein